MNFFLDAGVVLTVPILTLMSNLRHHHLASFTGRWILQTKFSLFFLSETVACNGIRENTTLFSLFESYAVLLDDGVELDSVSCWALPNGEVDISFSDDDVIGLVSWVLVTFASLLSGCGFGRIPVCCRVAITDTVTIFVICSDKAWISVALFGIACPSCFLRHLIECFVFFVLGHLMPLWFKSKSKIKYKWKSSARFFQVNMCISIVYFQVQILKYSHRPCHVVLLFLENRLGIFLFTRSAQDANENSHHAVLKHLVPS